MEIINGIINNTLTKNNKDYYEIIEDINEERYIIPFEQINNTKISIGHNYNFIKEYNTNKSKTFLSIIYSGYEIGKTIELEINDKIYNSKNIIEKFIFKNPLFDELKVSAFYWQESIKKAKCEIISYDRGKPILKNIENANPYYILNEKYFFTVLDFGEFTDKKGKIVNTVLVDINNNCKTATISLGWHTKALWDFKDVECEVIDFNHNGIPKLKIADKRHPKYEIGKTYNFKIKDFVTRYNNKTTSYFQVIILTDEHDCEYEVLALPNQENKLKKGEYIECKVDYIDTKIRFRQTNIDDPFFYSFEEIIKDKKIYENYFKPFLNTDNELNEKFKTKYESKSGFWVFTYCNIILPKLFNEEIKKRNFIGSIEINDLLITIEEWILKKGIIRAFNQENERKNVKLKVEHIIETRKGFSNVLIYLKNIDYDLFINKQSEKLSLFDLYHFLAFSDFELINEKDLIEIFEKINITNLTAKEYRSLENLAKLINNKKNIFISDINEDFFVFSKKISSEDDKKLGKYFNWSFCQYLIYSSLKDNYNKNYIISKILRYSVHSTADVNSKEILLFNAFFVLKRINLDFSIPYFKDDKTIILDLNKFEKNPNKLNNSEDWKKIKSKENGCFNVKIIEKHFQGYEIEYNNISGFLPFNNITDSTLKFYPFDKINWETNVQILLYSEDFNFFIANQFEICDTNYYSKNLNKNELPKIGEIITGKIKSVEKYGVFLTTEYGDGLLHLKDVSTDFIDKVFLDNYFIINDTIKIKVIANQENRIQFSFKELLNTEYKEYYTEYFSNRNNIFLNEIEIESYNNEDVEKIYELEKGYVFEQFAVLKTNINNKIHYIKLAKQFFSNTKNSRSYLNNIYIEYFNSILELDELLKDYSFEKYNEFKVKINSIKDRIQPQTLESFSESENLIFFINILSLFNEITDFSNSELIDYIKKYTKDDSKTLLKILAKTTLANNLLISEVEKESKKEGVEFSLKNLKRIRDYLNNGVFSLAETEEDRIEREIIEKMKFWRDKILQDEGEKLEFKSTLITPIPDTKKINEINNLKEKLSKSNTEIEKKGLKKALAEKENDTFGNVATNRIIHSAFKTINAFANTQGGFLLLGVNNEKEIFGLEKDYDYFDKKEEKNRDGFGKFFDNKLKEFFGDSFSSTLLNKEFLKFPEGDILIIEIKPSVEEIFLLKDELGNVTESIYVRNLSSTVKLEGKELSKFIKEKLRKQLLNK